MKIYEICIVGGGAAGLTAAAFGNENWVLLEKNDRLAKKIYATGNGRCNYMNMRQEGVEPLIAPELLREKLQALGIYGREEEEGRLYPRSGRAEDVAEALISAVKRAEVHVITGFDAVSAEKTEGIFKVRSRSGDVVFTRKLLLASGGKAGIQYGCEGGGLKIAAAFGHSVVKPIPALTSLQCSGTDEIAGVRVRSCISLFRNSASGKLLARDTGELQFTKNGLSGICTMNVSRFFRLSGDDSFTAAADLFPELEEDRLKGLFSARCRAFPGEKAEFLMNTLLPRKMADFVLGRAGIDSETPCGNISAEKLSELTRVCKSLEFEVSGSGGWKEAQVTCGGVELSQVNTGTMESLLVPGLYFAGEILDYDGPCGGYNLGWAFSTGLRFAQ